MTETDPDAGRTNRLTARLILPGLTLLFLAFWAGLLTLLGRTLDQLLPAALALDPAVLLLWLTLGPMTIHLAQAPFYRPRKPSGPPVFLGLAEPPLVFLPFSGPGRLKTGPAFFAAAGPEDQARILAAAEAHLAHGGRVGRLSLLMADRSPLDLAIRALWRGPWPLAAPAWLLHLLTSPTRQLMRFWGFIVFKAVQAWADPGPMEYLTIYKRRLALDLWRRSRKDPPEADEDGQIRRLARLRADLARIYNDAHYGAQVGEPWPEAGADHAASGRPGEVWLDPRYRGVFSDLPVTLYAPTPEGLYAAGRPEKNLGLFYPPELAPEAEAAAFLAAEGEFLAGLLADQGETGLVWLDGRFRPAWDLAGDLEDLEDRYDRIMKRIFIHHARGRAAHLAAAEALGRGWAEALRDWGALLWLAEHGRRALARAREDLLSARKPGRFFPRPAKTSAFGFFPQSATEKCPADARPELFPVSFPGAAAENFYTVWADIRNRLAGLGRPVPADLDPPAKSNWPGWRSEWLQAWARLDQALAQLRDMALAGLLTAEEQVAGGHGGPAHAAPSAPVTADLPDPPAKPRPSRVYYPSARFKVGPVSSALAALTLALLVWQGRTQGLSQVTIYNGLPAAVTVTANGQAMTLPPFGHRAIRLRPGGEYEFMAVSEGRDLEKFRQRLAPRPAREIYNVAGAAPLMEWWFPRAEAPGGSYESFLGRPRWLVTRATMLFRVPHDDRRALVLSGYGDADPADLLGPFHDPDEQAELARLHARHTPTGDPRFEAWLEFLPPEERGALRRERWPSNPAGTDGATDPLELMVTVEEELTALQNEDPD
ncbi:MAG: hypothetical protein LBC90_01610 [Candidatus Adiutrix sp.]|jgi:hypothetical protein|nr:hypothetical protein [Candidatus Adiutrix sp.]